jgi:hypothetical protein
MKIMLLASALASVAFAGTEELKALIQQKIMVEGALEERVFVNQALKSIDCSAHENLFCPLPVVPDVTFPTTGGLANSVSSTCCPSKYTQCQVQDNAQYCRPLLQYVIPESQGLNQELCPATTPDCQCQTVFNDAPNLRLKFCPETKDCCPICECHGDPHCRAFNGEQAMWATCDDRDPSCVHGEATCKTKTYDGQPCRWIPHKPGQVGYCTRAEGTKTPEMLMYAKTYKMYFNPADDNVYEYTLNLTLGTYGSVTRIDLRDTGRGQNVLSWFIDAAGDCKVSPGNPYPINGGGEVTINNLPSMVTSRFQCNSAQGRSPTSGRFDIHLVQDPWYSGDEPLMNRFWGFCATGEITEARSEEPGGCNTVDRQIVRYFGCSTNTALDKCRSNWCTNNAVKLNYTAIGGKIVNPKLGQIRTACNNFVNTKDPAKVRNFLAAVCSLSKGVGGNNPTNVDPTICESDSKCKRCMDNILDFPEDIAEILNPVTTNPPTKVCQDLLPIGLARKTLSKQASGVMIEYQNNVTMSWSGIFALLNEEIADCECKDIFVNGTVADNLVLTRPGKYRIRQCNGLDDSPEQDLCTSAPGYNTTVEYSNPTGGPLASSAYGGLFDSQVLVCNPQLFRPQCPANYACCMWDDSIRGWEMCMESAYGPNYKTLYPNCKYTGS